jgi:hypothetical protein
MDTAILSATSALVGSLIGAISTLAASLTLRGRLGAQALVEEAAKREVPSMQSLSSKRPDVLPKPGVVRPTALRLSESLLRHPTHAPYVVR